MVKDTDRISDIERIADALESIAGALESIEQNLNCIIYPDANNDSYLRAVDTLSVKGMQQGSYFR